MWALDIEEVRLAGKPRPTPQKPGPRLIRYPTEAVSLQDAVRQAKSGDFILITPGIYNESVEIRTDLTIERDGQQGQVLILARFDTPMLIDSCRVKLNNITLAVEEGSLLHHAMECSNAVLEMDDCEMYGGLYAFFVHQESQILARQCKFHNAYSFGANIMNSNAVFEDSYFFKNKEDGLNACGAHCTVSCSRCYIAENAGFGVQAHNGASVQLLSSDIVKNMQAGIAVTGLDEHQHERSTGTEKFSSAELVSCRIAGNLWKAVLVLDGTLKMENCDPRGNADGALTLSCSKGSVISHLESSGRIMDVVYYNNLESTGKIVLHDNIGLRDNGDTEIYYPHELPIGWQTVNKEEKQLHGYPDGFSDSLVKDPQARIRIVSLFKKWGESDKDVQSLDELEFDLNVFLKPLGLEKFVPKFAACKCFKLRDIMSFTDGDLSNLGVKDPSQRKLLLHRVSSIAGMLVVPRFMKQTKFGALIDATKLQANKDNMKARYKEWSKHKEHISRRVGVVTDGEDFTAKVKALFNEIDADGSATLDQEEIGSAMKRMGIQCTPSDVSILFAEADVDGNGYVDYEEFTLVMTALLRA